MSKMAKRTWSLATCAVGALLVMTVATASAETTLEKIKRTGVMTSANTFSYPPFGFIENGRWSASMSTSPTKLPGAWA
jgi:hypothetical protein